jgi:hypothetical protein
MDDPPPSPGTTAAGLFKGIPAGGAMGETAVNVKTGARVRLANVFASVFVIAIVVGLRQSGEKSGAAHYHRAEPDVFAATRKAVKDMQNKGSV